MSKAKRIEFISQARKLGYTHVQIIDWLGFVNAYSITRNGQYISNILGYDIDSIPF